MTGSINEKKTPAEGADDFYQTVKNFERVRVERAFIPYSVGTPSDKISFDNQSARCNLLFFSDSHIDFNTRYSLMNVKDTVEFANGAPFHLDAVLHGGDAITKSGVNEKAPIKALFADFANLLKKSDLPVLFAKGNHDLSDWNNIPENAFDDADWSEMWYDFAEEKWGIVRQRKANGEKSTWHCYDIEKQKVRVVCLDAQDTDKRAADERGLVKYYGGKAWYISNEQMNWVASVALNFDDKEEKDWGVVVMLHQDERYGCRLTPAFENGIQKLFDLCVAFNTQQNYVHDYTFAEDPFYDLHVAADFTRYAALDKKPHMICWLLGHEHVDGHAVVNGIHKIWIGNGSCSTAYSDARLARVAGTTSQNLFDLISIDTAHRKLRIVRYGAGVNCYGEGGDRFLPDGLDY